MGSIPATPSNPILVFPYWGGLGSSFAKQWLTTIPLYSKATRLPDTFKFVLMSVLVMWCYRRANLSLQHYILYLPFIFQMW